MGTLIQEQACSPREAPSPVKQDGLIHLKTKLEVKTEEDVGQYTLQAVSSPPEVTWDAS
jgi:hypothetical protein